MDASGSNGFGVVEVAGNATRQICVVGRYRSFTCRQFCGFAGVRGGSRDDPQRISLWLLPSGPDQVGDGCARPTPTIDMGELDEAIKMLATDVPASADADADAVADAVAVAVADRASAAPATIKKSSATLHVPRLARNSHRQAVKRLIKPDLACEPAGAGSAHCKIEHILLLFAGRFQSGKIVCVDNDMAGRTRHLPLARALQRLAIGLRDIEQTIARLSHHFAL